MKTSKSFNDQLFDAAKSGSAKNVERCLSQSGCDPLVRDEDGRSALIWAAHYGRETCVKLLLPRSDPLAKDDNGLTALMSAAHYGREACVRLLLPVSDPLALDKDGRSASQRARAWEYSAVVDMIDAYIAQREADILTGHVSSRPKQSQARRKPTPRL